MKSYCAGVEASIYYSDKQFPGYTVLFCICFALKIMYKKKKICIGRVLGCFKANVFFFLWLNVFVRKRKVKRTRLKIKKKSSAASCELFIYLHKLLFLFLQELFIFLVNYVSLVLYLSLVYLINISELHKKPRIFFLLPSHMQTCLLYQQGRCDANELQRKQEESRDRIYPHKMPCYRWQSPIVAWGQAKVSPANMNEGMMSPAHMQCGNLTCEDQRKGGGGR